MSPEKITGFWRILWCFQGGDDNDVKQNLVSPFFYEYALAREWIYYDSSSQ